MVDAIRKDGELLAEFATSGREAAFEELLRRHGPLVLGACRRLLGEGPDAEDAAQAVFLVLARKARSLGREGSLAGWLHRAARHIALRAREAAAVRRAREREAAVTVERSRSGEDLWAEVRPQLDRALDGLPERYRTPLILHHLEGRTQEEAAALLGVRPGTLSARLSRAREMLRQRLAQHGAVCSAALLLGFLAERAPAALPGSFVTSTVKAAALAAAGKMTVAAAGAGGVSAGVAALTEGVLKAMFWMKVKLVAGIAVAAVVVGAGVPLTWHAVRAAEAGGAAPPTVGAETPPKETEPEKKGLTDEEMRKLAEETARKGLFVSLDPAASKNPHLGGETVAANPLANARFWCVLQAHTPAAPRRAYICVDRAGKVTYPFAADGFGKLLAAEKTADWKDEAFLQAAQLYVQLTSVAHQDGLKLCKSADDFMAVKFNMFPQNEAKRQEAAKGIEAPKVVKADGPSTGSGQGKTTVTFHAWHLIGGALKRWTVEFGPEFKAEFKELGRFGGGGYE